jgi:hypothetical protein
MTVNLAKIKARLFADGSRVSHKQSEGLLYETDFYKDDKGGGKWKTTSKPVFKQAKILKARHDERDGWLYLTDNSGWMSEKNLVAI